MYEKSTLFQIVKSKYWLIGTYDYQGIKYENEFGVFLSFILLLLYKLFHTDFDLNQLEFVHAFTFGEATCRISENYELAFCNSQ